MLLHFIRILKITQIEVFLLQTTQTSPEPLRNARHIWETISLAPQETTLPAEADIKGAYHLGKMAPKHQTIPNSHQANPTQRKILP